MNIVTDLKALSLLKKEWQNKTIGFVPTMGHLHQGHFSLCERAKNENDIVVVSIFVNPTQFNSTNDFDCYPQTLEQDQVLLIQKGIDCLFLPTASMLYPDHFEVQVNETNISRQLEGEFRPGHFTGMMTVVLKLFNLMTPTRAYFGEKDYQQALLVKKMVQALFLPIEIQLCPTIREACGLAMSSRNSRLNHEERQQAAHFSQLLGSKRNIDEIKKTLMDLGFKVEYIVEKWQRRLGAVWLNDVRLIDNTMLPHDQ